MLNKSLFGETFALNVLFIVTEREARVKVCVHWADLKIWFSKSNFNSEVLAYITFQTQ